MEYTTEIKTYLINNIIPDLEEPIGYYVGIFEDTPDTNIEWPHRHGFFSFVWFTKGHGINVIDFDEYDILPNRIFTTNAKQIHNWNYSVDSCGYYLVLDEHLAKQLKIDFTSPFVDLNTNDIGFIEEIFRRMLQLGNQSTAISYLYSLLNGFKTDQISLSSSIAEFKRIIAANIDKNLTIEQYAEMLNISAETLNNRCKNEAGLTAKQLQLDLKITEAKRLLLYSSFNTSEISLKLGFEDNSYFSRIFRKKTNYSPANFREKYLKH
ncbi:MAG: helix-turn-helix domain-containing protein [Bacteroidales bacterium]